MPPHLQIAARELRLVQVHRVAVPSVGQPATFQLLRRPRDGITPELAGGEAAAAVGVSGTGSGGSGSAGAAGGAGEGEVAGGPAAGSPVKGGSAGQGSSKRGWPTSGGNSSSGAASSGGSAAPAGGRPGKGWPGKGAATACNRFSKFTLVSEGDATAMWVAEAGRLAQYAAQVGALWSVVQNG